MGNYLCDKIFNLILINVSEIIKYWQHVHFYLISKNVYNVFIIYKNIKLFFT